MSVKTIAANDNAKIGAIAFGPTILAGNYGSGTPSGTPAISVGSVKRTSNSGLAFTATSNGQTVNLGPFYDAHNFNYNVYWSLQ